MRLLANTLVNAAWTMSVVAVGLTAHPQSNGPSNDEIRRLLMQRSIASYSGNCPCPESRNSAGRRCGGNSAYSKPGGSRPLCYPSDVTDEMIRRHRESIPNL